MRKDSAVNVSMPNGVADKPSSRMSCLELARLIVLRLHDQCPDGTNTAEAASQGTKETINLSAG